MAYIFGIRSNFLFEKRNKSYIAYDAVSIEKEKLILNQKPFWSRVATANLAEKGVM